jgi:hypothetical protein
MAGGYFRVHRRVFEHEIFAGDPFSPREAWVWLIGSASWCATTVEFEGHDFNLQRGDLVASVRCLAEAWKWSKSATQRYLIRLRDTGMIGTLAGTQGTVITICNYDDYQADAAEAGTQTGTPVGRVPGHQAGHAEAEGGTPNEPPKFGANDDETTIVSSDADGADTLAGTPAAENRDASRDTDRDTNKRKNLKEKQGSSARETPVPQRPDLGLIRAFDAEIINAWGEHRARLCPTENDKSTARAWIDLGVSPGLITEAARKVCTEMQARGAEPPRGIGILKHEIERLRRRPTPLTFHERENALWAAKIDRWQRGDWLDSWGPRPGQPGCLMPARLQAKVTAPSQGRALQGEAA